jgi:putative membrane protein
MAIVSQTDKTRIEAAIRAAEARTSGEIFCVLAHRASDYRIVPLAWAAVIALALPWPLIHFTKLSATMIYLAQLLAFIVAALALSLPEIRFRIVPRRVKHDRAHALALQQFFAQGMQHTESRTGVLIFASMAERYAEVVADAGINAKTTPETWDKAVAALIEGLRHDSPGDGFVAAIERCGAALAQHFPPGTLDRDELANKLVEI